MATKRKTTKKIQEEEVKITPKEEIIEQPTPENIQEEPAKTVVEPEKSEESAKTQEKAVETELEKAEKPKTNKKKPKKSQKFNIGDIVYIKKDADADLNGFKLFPQYKKYTYTVEAYDEISGIYSLRRLNLSLALKEELILAPDERAHDMLNRKQF